MKRLFGAFALALLAASPVFAQSLTRTGAYQPPVGLSNSMTVTDTVVPATTNTTIAAANGDRIGVEIQCSAGPTKVSMLGATLTSASQGTGPAGIILPAANTLYIPAIASRTAITAYGPVGVCTVTDYSK